MIPHYKSMAIIPAFTHRTKLFVSARFIYLPLLIHGESEVGSNVAFSCRV